MEVSENFIIKKISKFQGKKREIERSIGDDGAVVVIEDGKYVFSQDILLEGVHFEKNLIDLKDIGKKAIYVNVSDILAMGAEPLYFLLSLGMPENFSLKDLLELLRGINSASKEFDLSLIGGDLSLSRDGLIIDVSIFGKLLKKEYLGRNKAKKGDLIAVTGYLGESSWGFHLLKSGRVAKRGSKRFIKRFKNPKPPYELWKELIKNDIPNAMMDISDGLIIDLERLLKESKRGGDIYFEKIPIPKELHKEQMELLALTGGEDYQFLFTFSKEKLPLFESLKKKGSPLFLIGKITERKGLRIWRNGKLFKIERKGYNHFRRTWTKGYT